MTQFVGWHNLDLFAAPPRRRDVLYQTDDPVWIGCVRSRALGILTPVVFLYLTDKVRSETGLDRDLVQKVAGVEYNVS